ncbi:MAG: hypothetical protein WKG07_16300 [Hymenobacter sp.]
MAGGQPAPAGGRPASLVPPPHGRGAHQSHSRWPFGCGARRWPATPAFPELEGLSQG